MFLDSLLFYSGESLSIASFFKSLNSVDLPVDISSFFFACYFSYIYINVFDLYKNLSKIMTIICRNNAMTISPEN